MTVTHRILTVGSGTALALLVTAASTPLLTRLYAPEAHAVWAIFLSLTAVFSGMATLRYELAVVLPKEQRTSFQLVQAGIITAFATAVLVGAALWLAGDRVLPSDLHDALRWWCWLVPLSIFCTALHQLAGAWCTREAAFAQYAAAQTALPLGILTGQFILAAAGRRDAWGLIGGTALGQLTVAGGLGWLLWRRQRELRPPPSLRETAAAASAYRNYPLYMAPYTVIGVVRERLAYFLLGRLGAVATVGYYNLVARLANLPNSFVASALRPVFFQHAVGKETRALEQPVLEIIRTLGLVAVLLWAPCIVQAPWLLGRIFGPDWMPAAPYAVALSLPAIPMLMGNWADRLFDVLGRQRAALKLEVIFSTIAMAGLVGGYWLLKDLLAAIFVQSLLLAIYYLVWLGVLFRLAGFALGGLVRSLATVVALGAASGLLCQWAGSALSAPVALAVTLPPACGAAAWVAWRGWRRLGKFLSI